MPYRGSPYFRLYFMSTIFTRLLQLPLFQGLNNEDFSDIVEKAKIHFVKYASEESFLERGEPCKGLLFVLQGQYAVTTHTADRRCTMTEVFEAPALIEPQALLGMNLTYTSSYRAVTELSTIHLDKQFVIGTLFQYEICRMNFMNMVSNRAQQCHNRLWSTPQSGLEARLAHLFSRLCEQPFGRKQFKGRMTDLALYLGASRLSVSRVLNRWHEDGMVELHRKGIVIPQLERLHERAMYS